MKRCLSLFLFIFIIAVPAFPDLTRDLVVAISKGRIKDVEKIVNKGANVNDHVNKDRTPLHWAVLQANLKIAAYLLGKGADVNSRDKNQVTPLEYCALLRNLDMLKLLVLKGADINLHDKYGWTALHYFTYYEDDLGVKYLIVQGAVLTNLTTQAYMDIDEKSTALDIAVKRKFSNIITALENPDRYMRLANRPILVMNYEKKLGNDNILRAPVKGSIDFTVENKGGFDSVNDTLVIEGISNTNGISFDNPPVINIGAGQNTVFSISFEASKDARDETAFFRAYACETNSFIKSDTLVIDIPKKPPLPPSLSLNSEPPESPGRAFHARTPNILKATISNGGSGYSENSSIQVVPLKGCEELTFSPVSNISLVPGESKTCEIGTAASDNIKDGSAEFLVVALDPEFNIGVTDAMKVPTMHLPRPLIRADFMLNGSPEETNGPSLKVLNTGDADAVGLSLSLQVFGISAGEGKEGFPLQDFHYSVQLIGTNDFMILKLPDILTNYIDQERFFWRLSGSDSEKLSSIDTNLFSGESR